jgi:hypothetical protein
MERSGAMSYQEIGERIKVLAVFKNGTVFPHIFDWNNLCYQEREGGSVSYFFAIEAKGLVAKLKYNDKSMIWTIEEVWVN